MLHGTICAGTYKKNLAPPQMLKKMSNLLKQVIVSITFIFILTYSYINVNKFYLFTEY